MPIQPPRILRASSGKRLAYDEALRVPFFIRYPKLISPGSVREELTLNIDVAPTLLELAGLDSVIPMHGESFVPLFKDNNASWRKAFLAEYFLEKVAPRTPTWQAVRTDRWKYIHYLIADEKGDPYGYDELYDLATDQKEITNLVNHPEHKNRLKEMRVQLENLLNRSK
ncbi:MAG TPA: hypothetical protein DIV79_03490 [Opitutae bacterium]|nr:hypothetical protein [Opitutaceae bacterium]HCR29062.1 hypothetical protein [Opitutae bacterium]